MLRGQRTNVPRQDKADLTHRELIQHTLQNIRDAVLVQIDAVDGNRFYAVLRVQFFADGLRCLAARFR